MKLKERKKRLRENNETTSEFPIRNIDRLNVCSTTLNCALQNPCIPCAYKIGNFDIALDKEFSRIVPNTRPELCPRSFQNKKGTDKEHCTYGYGPAYQRGMNVLCVGDGDFTFSLAIARLIRAKDGDGDSLPQSQLVASSYESLPTLQKVYPDIDETISEMKALGVQVCFEVDATQLLKTLPAEVNKVKFHRIAWNFPCTAIANGQDGQNGQMLDNKRLVKEFVVTATRDLLDEHVGEIHMIHKTKPPYDQWNLEKAALAGWASDTDDDKEESNEGKTDSDVAFEFKGRVVFDKCLLPPYTPRKALDKKSFPCHDACLYVFGWKELSLSPSTDAFPPTIKHAKDEIESEVHGIQDGLIIPVDRELIGKVRDAQLLEKNQTRRSKSGKSKRAKKRQR